MAYAVILLARGIPALYYGDEQGFTGLPKVAGATDQNSREDMFPTRVAAYAATPHLGAPAEASAADHFDMNHPLYRDIAALVRLRKSDPALLHGAQIVRASGDKPGLFAFSRIADGHETLAIFNTSAQAIDAHVIVEPGSKRWTSVAGKCEASATATESYRVRLAPLDYIVCRSELPDWRSR